MCVCVCERRFKEMASCARESRETLERLAPYVQSLKETKVSKVGVSACHAFRGREVQLARVTVVSESRWRVYRC